MDKQTTPETTLTYATTGVVLAQLASEKNLESYSHIIVDEVHERDQNIDFLLLIIKKLFRTQNSNTKVVLYFNFIFI